MMLFCLLANLTDFSLIFFDFAVLLSTQVTSQWVNERIADDAVTQTNAPGTLTFVSVFRGSFMSVWLRWFGFDFFSQIDLQSCCLSILLEGFCS
jgi:hypothetical protein